METIEKVSLWCPTCQRGLGKLNENNVYSVGDTCPMCLQAGRREFSDKLMDVKEYERQLLEAANFKKEQSRKKALKGIKAPDVRIKELQESYENRMRAMESENAELKEAVNALLKKSTRKAKVAKTEVKTPTEVTDE